MSKLHHYPDHFQHQALELIHRLLPLNASAFYLVAPDMREHGVALSNLSRDTEDQYQQSFKALDPLNPNNFRHSDRPLAVLDQEVTFEALEKSLYYQEFMLPHQHRHVIDLFFRQEGEIIAVATLLRQRELGPFGAIEIELLENLQPFLQFTLNNHYQPKRFSQRLYLQQKYQLTKRELEVVGLVLSGHSNKAIARSLELGLATVKTHLLHVFQKAQVSSRTELLSQVMNDL